ncbi:MAG: hypothetical protein LUF00_09450 [Lachnospiraceae bacterium]|nr:hypothetical protein [Lachnospiraceae bacterium]
MRKLISITLLFCMLLSVSGCANTQESNVDTSVSEVVGSTDAVEAETATPDSDGEETTSVDSSQKIASETEEQSDDNETAEENTEEETMNMKVQIGDSVFTAALEENEAVNALVEMMEEAPVVIEMSDYSGFEKVGPLGTSLPTSNSQTTTQAGDIVLYNGNQIVIFYGSNSWSYTRLGHIDDLTGWEEALGSGDVTVIFSLN